MHAIDDFRFTKLFTAPRGGEFVVKRNGHFFEIHMKSGGVRPNFTQTLYTSYSKAVQALKQYFKENPKPVPRDEKVKTKAED